MSTALQDILVNHVKAKFARDEVVASMTVRLVRDVEIARIGVMMEAVDVLEHVEEIAAVEGVDMMLV